MLRKWNTRLNGTAVEILEWNGSKSDEGQLNDFCEGQLQYVLDSGLAAIGEEPFVTDRYAGPGDLVIRHADLTGLPILRIPGDVEWIRELFGVIMDPNPSGPIEISPDA